MESQIGTEEYSASCETLQQIYQEALLRSAIQAANLLTELIELKMMPDPRAKEMAEVALEVLKIVNASSIMQTNDEPRE